MKKKLLLIGMSIMTATLITSASFAAKKIQETPKVKIVIDGKAGKYKKSPIITEGKTLLPFREVLTNLGVQNDDEHIIWNKEDRSITVLKDDTKIQLTIGSKEASINDVSQKIDVAPIVHKNSTYIPARFISQALGKKVVWDGSSKSVIIREQSEFDDVKAIMDKSTEAMKGVTKYKGSFKADIAMKADGQSIDVKSSGSMDIDMKNYIIHMNTKSTVPGLAQPMDVEYYYADNKMYMAVPPTNTWTYMELPMDQFQKQFDQNSIVEYTEAMYAGLVIDDSNPKELVLKGDVYIDELFSKAKESLNGASIEMNSVNMEMTIDKNTYFVTKVKMTMNMDLSIKEGSKTQIVQSGMDMEQTYLDFNGNFKVAVPSNILKSATPLKL